MLISLREAAEKDFPACCELSTSIRSVFFNNQNIIVSGARGLGQIKSSYEAILDVNPYEPIKAYYEDGSWLRAGYLAGFYNLILTKIDWAETYVPTLITRHEQTLKRILPTLLCSAYKVPKDLTNSSAREERTRFYHHEYQNKLLVGIAEFILDAMRSSDQSAVIVIDNADLLSPTSKSLLGVITRIEGSAESLRFILLDRSGTFKIPNSFTVNAPSYSINEFTNHLSKDHNNLGRFAKQIYILSQGNLRIGQALLVCSQSGVSLNHYLTAHSVFDFYLSTLDLDHRIELANDYVRARFIGDPVAERNAQLLPKSLTDDENIKLHCAVLDKYKNGQGPLVAIHALAIDDKTSRIEALTSVCDILMGIGLYDTWFDIFSPIYIDPDLRKFGDGNSDVNGLFINAAFVLYSMGHVGASSPFLKEFLAHFPSSHFVPTALYALSMTYGRYSVPVDLETAEKYAKKNLILIDSEFANHSRYYYIKAFAENAYAYILARKGMLKEALLLCEEGIRLVTESYGEELFKLHKSILVYNTSQIYEIIGDNDMAEDKLKEAISLDPFYAEYHNDLGNLLSKSASRTTEAMASYDKAIAFSPPYYEAYLNRGLLRVSLGDLLGAEDDFRRALEIKPDEWRAFRELGNLMLQQGNLDKALNAYLFAIDVGAEDPDLYVNLGVLYSETGRIDDAIDCYQLALNINSNHIEAHNNLAAELVSLGEYKRALTHATVASRLSQDQDILDNLRTIEELAGSLS